MRRLFPSRTEYITDTINGTLPMSKDKKTSSFARQIDENLQRVYRDGQENEIPDRFQHLLQQLKEKDKGPKDD